MTGKYKRLSDYTTTVDTSTYRIYINYLTAALNRSRAVGGILVMPIHDLSENFVRNINILKNLSKFGGACSKSQFQRPDSNQP